MSEMVERVARAIADWQEPGTYDAAAKLSPFDSRGPHIEHFRIMARAAIAAMREPTEGMKAAWTNAAPAKRQELVLRYHAMIDAALAQG